MVKCILCFVQFIIMTQSHSNPDELLMSQVSIILSQTINPVWNHKFKPMKLPGKQVHYSNFLYNNYGGSNVVT